MINVRQIVRLLFREIEIQEEVVVRGTSQREDGELELELPVVEENCILDNSRVAVLKLLKEADLQHPSQIVEMQVSKHLIPNLMVH